jgi:hypothetical protein
MTIVLSGVMIVRRTKMLAVFGLGILVGTLAVIGLLRLTMCPEPTGCVVVFGFLTGLLFLIVATLLW